MVKKHYVNFYFDDQGQKIYFPGRVSVEVRTPEICLRRWTNEPLMKWRWRIRRMMQRAVESGEAVWTGYGEGKRPNWDNIKRARNARYMRAYRKMQKVRKMQREVQEQRDQLVALEKRMALWRLAQREIVQLELRQRGIGRLWIPEPGEHDTRKKSAKHHHKMDLRKNRRQSAQERYYRDLAGGPRTMQKRRDTRNANKALAILTGSAIVDKTLHRKLELRRREEDMAKLNSKKARAKAAATTRARLNKDGPEIVQALLNYVKERGELKHSQLHQAFAHWSRDARDKGVALLIKQKKIVSRKYNPEGAGRPGTMYTAT